MNSIVSTIFVCLALLLPSCQSPTKTQPLVPFLADAYAEAGWEVGKVYKTMKRGGVEVLGRSAFRHTAYALVGESTSTRVRKAWRNPSYNDEWLSHRVEIGSLFRVTSIEWSPGSGYCHVYGVQLAAAHSDKKVLLSLFRGKIEERKAPSGWINVRDPDYLVLLDSIDE